MKRDSYVLSETFVYRIDIHDSIEIPKYSHVVPMDPRWVPEHIKKKYPIGNGQMYVYTKFGIILVPSKIVRVAN